MEKDTAMRHSVLAMILAALLAAPLVMAQISLHATVPFAFNARGHTLPAGEWTLARIDALAAGHVWTLKDSEWRGQLLVVGNAAYRQPDGRTSLMFNCYSGRCFLSEIRWPGGAGTHLPACEAEKNLLLAGVKPERTVLFARLR
jgi:hypothetical protein